MVNIPPIYGDLGDGLPPIHIAKHYSGGWASGKSRSSENALPGQRPPGPQETLYDRRGPAKERRQ